MSEIEVEKIGTMVTAHFPQEGVTIQTKRINDSEYGSFRAEIKVFAKLLMNGVHEIRELNRSRPDLLDDGSKDRLIRNLEEKTQDYPGFFWGNIIDQAFNEIIDKHREGEAAIIMGDLEGFEPRNYAIKPIFRKGVANLIWARGGSAKSYYGLLSCVMIDQGLSLMGLKARKGVALYLDWEETEDLFKQRLKALHKGLGLPPTSGIIYKSMAGSLANNIEIVSELVNKHGVTFMVVDSVGAALGGSGIEQQVVEDYFAAGNLLKITWLSIDHANRAGETTGNWAIHGSAYKYARSRMVYEVKKVQENDSGDMEMVLYHRKGNDDGIKSPRGFSVKFVTKNMYNPEEDDYDEQLDMVTFSSMKMGDANNKLLQRMTIPEICYSLIEAHGPTPMYKLAESVSHIKDATVSEKTIEDVISDTKSLSLGSDGITVYATSSQEVNEWTV